MSSPASPPRTALLRAPSSKGLPVRCHRPCLRRLSATSRQATRAGSTVAWGCLPWRLGPAGPPPQLSAALTRRRATEEQGRHALPLGWPAGGREGRDHQLHWRWVQLPLASCLGCWAAIVLLGCGCARLLLVAAPQLLCPVQPMPTCGLFSSATSSRSWRRSSVGRRTTTSTATPHGNAQGSLPLHVLRHDMSAALTVMCLCACLPACQESFPHCPTPSTFWRHAPGPGRACVMVALLAAASWGGRSVSRVLSNSTPQLSEQINRKQMTKDDGQRERAKF